MSEYCVENPQTNMGWRIEAPSWEAAEYYCRMNGLKLLGEFAYEEPWNPDDPADSPPVWLLPGSVC